MKKYFKEGSNADNYFIGFKRGLEQGYIDALMKTKYSFEDCFGIFTDYPESCFNGFKDGYEFYVKLNHLDEGIKPEKKECCKNFKTCEDLSCEHNDNKNLKDLELSQICCGDYEKCTKECYFANNGIHHNNLKKEAFLELEKCLDESTAEAIFNYIELIKKMKSIDAM